MAAPAKPARSVLVIGDDPGDHPSISACLAEDGRHCRSLTWREAQRADLNDTRVDLIVADASDPEAARRLFEWLRNDRPAIPILAILPADEPATVGAAVAVADDFVFAPLRPLELRHRVARLLDACGGGDAITDRERMLRDVAMAGMVGSTPSFLDAIRMVPRFATLNATVLITGETGTGKEVCARAIHHLGPRRHAPFVAVDCAATPDQLFENELFGHARGAFTDAHREQKGLVAVAEGGTLFLDEIDSLSLPAQAKLLRFLQDQSYRPLGSERIERANVRVIAASNRDLEARVASQEFRGDLFFRLNILRVQLPPLRDRRDDIPLLAEAMLGQCREREGTTARAISSAALRMLTVYEWPGNVRELANVVHRTAVACDGLTILPEHVGLPAARPASPPHFRAARAAAIAVFERSYVQDLLRRHAGNVTRAAREAQQDRRAFGRVIKRHNIDRRAR